MRYADEYRDPKAAAAYAQAIKNTVTRPWTIMEVCGGQTHAIVKYGIDELIPDTIRLVHGPGCPVCVTPVEMIDTAIRIAQTPNVIFCSFGDMVRVPGSACSLMQARAAGADVRMVYSPLDAVRTAQENPQREVVFFAVGFETTAPANAMAVLQAEELGLTNFSILVSQVLVPPAMEAILAGHNCGIQAFLAAGHVCAIMGCEEYGPIAKRYRTPIVVTGFEPLDLLQGVLMCVKQLEEGRFEVENQYSRAVRQDGSATAQQMMQRVFKVVHRKWRGIGEIPASGLGLRPEYDLYNAATKFAVSAVQCDEPADCMSGLVLQGLKQPVDCPAFGGKCTPDHPLGATMVSTEGACAAYYRYRSRSAANGKAVQHG